VVWGFLGFSKSRIVMISARYSRIQFEEVKIPRLRDFYVLP
jgi:hypothetical protein